MAEFAFQFWDRVGQLLEQQNKTTRELSENIGTSYDVIRQWKSKRRYPKVDVQMKIADFLGTTVEYLMSGSEENASSLSPEMIFVRDHQEAKALIRAIMDDPALLYPISALVTRKAPEEKKEHA